MTVMIRMPGSRRAGIGIGLHGNGVLENLQHADDVLDQKSSSRQSE